MDEKVCTSGHVIENGQTSCSRCGAMPVEKLVPENVQNVATESPEPVEQGAVSNGDQDAQDDIQENTDSMEEKLGALEATPEGSANVGFSPEKESDAPQEPEAKPESEVPAQSEEEA